jgi:hypothetical protein
MRREQRQFQHLLFGTNGAEPGFFAGHARRLGCHTALQRPRGSRASLERTQETGPLIRNLEPEKLAFGSAAGS